MKKILSFITLLFLLFSTFSLNVEAATFVQKSARQNSEAVANNDPVTTGKWNSVILDLSNIIEDLASLKDYIDDNINGNFIITPSRMESMPNRDVAIGKSLYVGGDLQAGSIDITEDGLKDNTIVSGDIKDGTVKEEDFESGVHFGNKEYWTKKSDGKLYNNNSTKNVAIGHQTASERLEVGGVGMPIGGLIAYYDFYGKNTYNKITEVEKGLNGGKFIKDELDIPNAALYFQDNTTDYLNLDKKVLSNLENFTLSWRVKRVGENTSIYTFISGESTRDNDLFFAADATEKKYVVGLNDKTLDVTTSEIPAYVKDTLWHTITWVKDGKESKIYEDGNYVGKAVSTTDAKLKEFKDVIIGQKTNKNNYLGGFSDTQNFNGILSYFNAYDRALSDNEVKKVHDFFKNPGNIYIKTTGNGIKYSDGTFQDTAIKPPRNILHLTNDETVDGNKKFDDNVLFADNEEWVLVYTQDINNVSGWSFTNDTTVCAERGKMVGGYGKISGDVNEKTFNLGGLEHNKVKVVLDYYAIDSWDGEKAYVELDGTRLFNKTPNGNRVDKCGRPNAPTWGERVEHVVVEKDHTGDTLKIGVGSTLNQEATDESFAFNNLKIYVKTKDTPINNVKGISDAFVNPDHNSIVTTEALRTYIDSKTETAGVVQGVNAICGGDNGRKLLEKPSLLCEYGEVQDETQTLDLVGENGITYSSCSEIKEANPYAQSGVYSIKTDNGPVAVYCDMETDGGGWMLVLKADGTKETFEYDSPLWTNDEIYHPENLKNDRTEFKSSLFNTQKFNEIMLEFESLEDISYGERHKIQFAYSGNSLKDVFNGGTQYITNTTRKDWTNLLPKNGLQPYCNKMGFNILYGQTDVRLGISANNENDCSSNDSNLGIGLNPRISSRVAGKPQSKASVGNNVFLTDYMAYGYLFIRDKKPQIPVQKNCRVLKEEYNLGSGKYKVKPVDQEIEVYCDMETDGGGWMKVLENAKYGGKYETTYTINKNYGPAKEFLAKQKSGYVTCSTNRTNETNVNWNRCQGAGSFEIKYNGNFIFKQNAWRKPAPGCNRLMGGNSPFVCKRDASVEINNGSKLTPTWYEPSRNYSLGDNGGDMVIDLYVRDKAPEYKKTLRNCREIKEQYNTGDGFYTIMTDDGRKEVFCEMTYKGGGWTMIGRGREGWAWNNDGKNNNDVAAIKNEFGDSSTDASINAFIPAYYKQKVVKSIIDGKKMNELEDYGLWIRRAEHKYGHIYQNVLWKYDLADEFSWTFDTGAYSIKVKIDGEDVSTNDGTKDIRLHSSATNNEKRLFTWGWSQHDYKKGFPYGAYGVGEYGSSGYASYLRETSRNENHSIPYAEVYIRDKAPDYTIHNDINEKGITDVKLKVSYKWKCITSKNEVNCGADKIITGGPSYIIENGGIKEYSDGTQARSCLEYLNGKDTAHPYEGATGSGYYFIKPSQSATKIKTYCDMATNGGGWTRYFNAKGTPYGRTAILNCFKGEVIDNKDLECFNPHRFTLTAKELMGKISGNTYFRTLGTDNGEDIGRRSTHSSNRYCRGNKEYFAVMAHSHPVKDDYSNVLWVRPGLDYCQYGRGIGGNDGGGYMNYSSTGNFGPTPNGHGRERTPKPTELFIR